MGKEVLALAHEITFTEETDSLEGIELTPEGKKTQKELEFVKEASRAELLDDPVRLEIVKILRQGIQDTQTTRESNEENNETIIRKKEVRRNIMSVTEIVKVSEENEQFNKVTKNQAYYHLPKLIEANFVIKYGTVETGDRTTDYYRRTARSFVLTRGRIVTGQKEVRERNEKHVKLLSRVFDLGLSEEDKEKLVELLVSAEDTINKARPEMAERISGDVADKEVIDTWMWLLRLYAFGDEEWVKLQRSMHNLVFGKESQE
jgi:DNA-binding transcriptional ArsR family regulator